MNPWATNISGDGDGVFMEGVNEGTNIDAVVDDEVQILLDCGPEALRFLTNSFVVALEGKEYHTNAIIWPSKQSRRL